MRAQSSSWMRFVVVAAAAHAVYCSLYLADSIEVRSLWLAVAAGLAFASVDPIRYWPAVLPGLIARVLPSIAYAMAGRVRPAGSTFTDAIWWAPLSFIVVSAYLARVQRLRERSFEVLDLALRARTDRGSTIEALSRTQPVLLVFLRHTGCMFCREALGDLGRHRRAIEASGATIVLVHMGEPEFGRAFFRKYGLSDLPQISAPDCSLYRAFGLHRTSFLTTFSPRIWVRMFQAGVLKGHGVGRFVGDIWQMPGVFLIFHGQILRSYRHQTPADRPDYLRIVSEDAFTRMVS
jgi:peroxiredoxin